MSSSVGIKTAVPHYQLLDRKIPSNTVMETLSNYSSEDKDFLHPKPNRLTDKTVPFQDRVNVNNSNVSEPEKPTHDTTGLSKLFDDMGLRENSVPVPFAWSPGMTVTSNKSLFITPQKSSIFKDSSLPTKDQSLPMKGHIFEPESANKIPKAVPWSPGMEVQLDPNLFITPDKCQAQKVLAGINDKRENSKQSVPSKAKEGYSVRFDLPPSTSSDDTADSLSETDSPITLRGCEISKERQLFESPIWKTFSPHREYNPIAYSDDSCLEESIINCLPTVKNDLSHDHTKACVVGSGSDSSTGEPNDVAFKLPATTSQVSSPQIAVLKLNELGQHLAVAGKRDTKHSSSSFKPHKTDHSKSNILVTTKAKAHFDMKRSDRPTPKGESHLPSSLTRLSESPTHEATVIREMKDNLLSTEYSFPFELRAATQDSEYEHVFTRPEYNSTLKVRAELNTLYDQEVDVATAVEASLAKSEAKRLELNEKAAAYTNRMSSQFKNLVDLNTSVETLCDRIVRMRTSCVVSKKRGAHLDKKVIRPDRAPDLLEFFTSDLQREVPDLTLPGVARVTSKLMTVPQDTAFDLYRHNRIWQGIHDF